MLDHLGFGEIGVLLLLALFIFGPERLPGIAAEAGKALRKARGMLKGMTDDLKVDFGPEIGDLDLRSLNPKEFVRKALMDDDEPAVASGSSAPGMPVAAVALRAGESAPWDAEAT